MIHPKVTEKLLDYINKSYSGGVTRFCEEGGDMLYLPESIILCFPKDNPKMRMDIQKTFPDVPFLFLSEPFDITVQTMNDIRNRLIEVLMEDEVGAYSQVVSISVRPCFILVQTIANIPDVLVHKIRKMFESFNIPRVLFLQPQEEVEVWEMVIPQKNKPVINKGEGVISPDQITDLKIGLHKEQDVMDFLKSLES
jgi:hypothetical protein